jgi:hypothetical protein
LHYFVLRKAIFSSLTFGYTQLLIWFGGGTSTSQTRSGWAHAGLITVTVSFAWFETAAGCSTVSRPTCGIACCVGAVGRCAACVATCTVAVVGGAGPVYRVTTGVARIGRVAAGVGGIVTVCSGGISIAVGARCGITVVGTIAIGLGLRCLATGQDVYAQRQYTILQDEILQLGFLKLAVAKVLPKYSTQSQRSSRKSRLNGTPVDSAGSATSAACLERNLSKNIQ